MLLVAGATAGEVTVRNVSMLSKQADTAICTALVRAGAAVINEEDSVTALHRPLRAFEFDATNCPDLFPALAALAAAGLLSRSAMVCNCGLPNEEVWLDLADYDPARSAGYFATILVKEG